MKKHRKLRSGSNEEKNYTEVPANRASESLILFFVAFLALVFMAFFMWAMISNKNQTTVVMGGIALAIFAGIIYQLLDRCPKCHTKYSRRDSPSTPEKRFVICESCKTFFFESTDSGV
jgi:predicted Zn finger-like uncharacterized protein